MSSSSGTTWDFGTRLGLIFVVEAACSSALAVTGTLLFIGYNAVNVNRGTWSIETHIHYYFLNLMIFDLIKAIGGIMTVKWIAQAFITQGSFCTAQGAIKQFGNVGVALTSLVSKCPGWWYFILIGGLKTIAVHTFCVLVFHWRFPIIIAPLIIGLIWVFVILIIGISFATHTGQVYYGNVTYWCWITSRYPGERIGLEYLWMWVAALVDIFVYFFLALVVTGFISVNGGKIRITTGEERVPVSLASISSRGSAGRRDGITMAIKLLFYPAVYVITIFPFTVVRFVTFNNPKAHVPLAATVFASMLFSSSGFFNVILFALTRPNLLRVRGPSAPMTLEPPVTAYSAPGINGYLPNLPEYGTDVAGDGGVSPDGADWYLHNKPRSFLP